MASNNITSKRRRVRCSVLILALQLLFISNARAFIPTLTSRLSTTSGDVVTRGDSSPVFSAAFDPMDISLSGSSLWDVGSARIERWKRKTQDAMHKFAKKKTIDEEEYEQTKAEWEAQFCNLESLRELFGENQNKLWGDLDASTTRRLYKILLPRALLGMYQVGLKPEDLAPLAYQARLAAKLYTRERSQVPSRVFAQTLDGVRAYKKFGKFQTTGMTYPQIWSKYERIIMDEIEDEDDVDDDAVTAQICLKILERSCQTNSQVDNFFLKNTEGSGASNALMQEQMQDLSTVIDQLEREVKDLLEPVVKKTENERQTSRMKTLRLLVRAKRRLDELHPLQNTNNSHEEHQGLHTASNSLAPSKFRHDKHNHREKNWISRNRI